MGKQFSSILEIDDRLKSVIHSVIGPEINVNYDPPSPALTPGSLSAYLFRIKKANLPDMSRNPLQLISVQYLVTGFHKDYRILHSWIEALVFAFMGNEEFELSLDPVEDVLWNALRIPPTPSLILSALLKHEQKIPEIKIVREPLIAREAFLRKVECLVLGGNARPIEGACVFFHALGLSFTTDAAGKFYSSLFPADVTVENIKDQMILKIKEKERRFSVVVLTQKADEFRLQLNCLEA
jgi:hypothetical protein